ncbi:hypothetical protein [Thalassotalea sp. PLHSN55]|uniref:hypothetical protein n=1 Tax=Thalassotalea sp. PLHSN55 TaxID=3435888 RepID=UPI003F857132
MKTALIANFTGKRWLKITLRSLHLVGIAGVFASLFSVTDLSIYWFIAIASGVGLLMLEALSNLVWFVQVRALVMYIKLALFICVYIWPIVAWQLMVCIILLSGVISHAPSSVRYFSFVHFKKIKSVTDIKG